MFKGLSKQGRIHGSTVAGGWAGAVMAVRTLKRMCDRQTNHQTDRLAYRSRYPRQKSADQNVQGDRSQLQNSIKLLLRDAEVHRFEVIFFLKSID